MTTDNPAVDWQLSEHEAGVLLRLLNLQAGQADPVWQPYWQQQVARLKAAMAETGQGAHRRLAAARHQGNGHTKQPLPIPPEPADLEHQVAELTRANHDYRAEITRLKEALLVETAQREQAEAGLTVETEWLRLLFEFAPDAYYVNDLGGKFLAGNQAAEEMTGYSRQELIGKNFLETNLLSPEEAPKAVANLASGARGQATGPDEFTLARSDGRRVTVEIRTYPVVVAGQTVVLGIARDITGRKQVEAALRASEKRYRAIVEDQADLICRFGPDGRLTFVNEAYCRYFGRSRDDLVGRPFTPLIPPEDRAFVAQQVGSVSPDRPLVTYEHRVIRPDGTIAWQQWSDRAIFDEQGGLIEIQSVGRDITERKQAEVTLQESNRRLEIALAELKVAQAHLVQQERLAAVGQVAAGIAHEFNNILTSMLGFAELLQAAPDTPAQTRTDLMHIIQPGRRAAHLVRQLLDFSRKSLRRPQPLDLDRFVPETVEFLHHALAEDIQVCLAVDPGLYRVQADPTQLQQMLANLVFNARDAMPGGGTLRVRLTRLEVQAGASCMGCHQPISGDWICLAVTDTGSGIATGILPHIFEPFFTTKQVGQGTGLGLAQVLGIVHQHAGHITVTSRVGRGTTVAIYWPPAKDAGS